MNSIKSFMRAQPALTRALGLVEQAGESAHLVGGAVRDALVGRASGDLDIATSAHPETVRGIFERAGARVHDTGLDHGTLTVVVDDTPIEITTWRKDVSTDGCRATVAFANSLVADAKRRDFTINALHADAYGVITDPTNQGLADLHARRVRFIGTPGARIREDSLRILRYYRITAMLGWTPDPASADAQSCKSLAALTRHLSRERVGQEMRKLLASPVPDAALMLMMRDGILDHVLDPTRNRRILRKRLAMLHMAENLLDLAPDTILRLELLADTPPSDELRLSRHEEKRFRTLRKFALGADDAAMLGYRLGDTDARAALALRHILDTRSNIPDDAVARIERGARAKFPVSGHDLDGLFSGPDIGRILNALESRWIASDFSLTREDMLTRPNG